MWKCQKCNRTFPVFARISIEKRPINVGMSEVTRIIIDKACCPFCESTEIEEVKL